MTSGLRLVKAFNKNDYPFKISVSIAFDPENNPTDRIFSQSQDYLEHKALTKPALTLQNIRAILYKGNVEDYCLYRNETGIELHLRTEEDAYIACAGLIPQNTYGIDFYTCSVHDSKRKMKKKAQKLQTFFNHLSIGKRLSFSVDPERRMIKLHTANGQDFVEVFGVMRRLEKSPHILTEALSKK